MLDISLAKVLNRMSEEYVYGSGSCDFERLYEQIGEKVDLKSLTIEDAKYLGFCRWDEEYPNLWLMPIWLFPIIPEGMELMDINGEKFKFERDKADKDIRFGCLAYGIEIGGNE